MKLKNYDPNFYRGTHTVKVTFIQWDFTGYLTYQIGGNVKGLDILGLDVDILLDTNFVENPINLTVVDEDWFLLTLKNKDGVELELEGDYESLRRCIIGVEIIEFNNDGDN